MWEVPNEAIPYSKYFFPCQKQSRKIYKLNRGGSEILWEKGLSAFDFPDELFELHIKS